jgi:hypothetical protein
MSLGIQEQNNEDFGNNLDNHNNRDRDIHHILYNVQNDQEKAGRRMNKKDK